MAVVLEEEMHVYKGLLDTLMLLGVISLDQYLDVLLGIDQLWRVQDIEDYKAKKHYVTIDERIIKGL